MRVKKRTIGVVNANGFIQFYEVVPDLYDVNSATAPCCKAGLPRYKRVPVTHLKKLIDSLPDLNL